MSFDPAPVLRRLAPDAKTAAPALRQRETLPFLDTEHVMADARIALDATVYIDVLQAKAPPLLALLLRVAYVAHIGPVLAELAHALGRLDPKDPRTPGTGAQIEATLARVRPDRAYQPDLETFVEAGVLNGMMARLLALSAGDRSRNLNDCLIYFTARRNELTLVTRNVRDFDRIEQLAPGGRLLFYEQT